MTEKNVEKQVHPVIKQELDYAKFLKIVASRWYWVLSTLILSSIIAYTYIWYTQAEYSAALYMKFEQQESGIEELLKQNTNGPSANTISSESWVIKSDSLVTKAVSNMDWEVSYFIHGKIRDSEMYPDKPFIVEVLHRNESFYSQPVYFVSKGEESIQLTYGNENDQKVVNCKYGDVIAIPGVKFQIKRNNTLSADKEFYFVFNNIKSYANRMKANLYVGAVEKLGNIAVISKTDTNPYFARDAIDAIIKEYLNYDISKKTQSAEQVIDFIDNQLAYLATKVGASGNKLKEFKKNNNFFQLGDAAKEVLNKVNRYQTEIQKLQFDKLYLDQLERNINNNQSALNFNFTGSLDPVLANLTNNWNQLIKQRDEALKLFTPNSKTIKDLDAQKDRIKSLAKNNILENRKTITQQISILDGDLNEELTKLKGLPDQEMQLFNLEREYEINDKIFTLLSEKKLESQISQASVLAGATVIDPARANLKKVSPNSQNIWKFAVIIGLASGISLIFLVRLLKPYIYDKEIVESLTNTPIIGLIRHYGGKIDENSSQVLSIIRPKSLFAESVRSVRTNLSFIAGNEGSKVICITSEISGEGKSFVSLNIAASLGLIEKRVILIAADLRKSKLHKVFKLANKEGLSSFLAGNSRFEDIIHSTEHDNLDILPSGPVPPNPAELMYREKLKDLITELKKTYDYIIFDTAPIGLVSDALPLIRVSDINLFVIRTGKSKFSAASIPDRIAAEYQLKNTFIILNDFVQDALYSHYYSTKYSDGYYGYYYSSSTYDGDGYYDNEGVKRKWWKRKLGQIKKKVKERSS